MKFRLDLAIITQCPADEPMGAVLLPLFPLEVVLFPGSSLPLHIFEERYRILVADVIDGGRDVSFVLAQKAGMDIA